MRFLTNVLFVAILTIFTVGCNNNSESVEENTNSNNSLTLEDRTYLDRSLKSGNFNKLSYKLDSFDSIGSVEIKLPFEIVNPILINFYNDLGVKLNLEKISFSQENWDTYQTVAFSENIDSNELYYQIEDLEDQGDVSEVIRLISDEFIKKSRESKSLDADNELTDEEISILLEKGFSLEEIEELLSLKQDENKTIILTILPSLDNSLNPQTRTLKSNSCENTLWTSGGFNVHWWSNYFRLKYKTTAYTRLKDNCGNPVKAEKIGFTVDIYTDYVTTIYNQHRTNHIRNFTESKKNSSEVTMNKTRRVTADMGYSDGWHHYSPKITLVKSSHSVKYKWLERTDDLSD